VTDVADITGFPPILGDRVKTLHPKVHGGLLADRTDPAHIAEMEAYGIEPLDLVVSNLYPFASDPGIDLIDIGGPAMVRAAAKNHEFVGVVVDPADYPTVLDELRAAGRLSDATRLHLAHKAYATTSAYDATVAAWLGRQVAGSSPTDDETASPFGPTLEIVADRVDLTLRYGENPHQRAALYRTRGAAPWWDRVTQHSGMDLSYLNLFDADAAWLLAHDLAASSGLPACAIIKHANPCGAAVARDPADAYQGALDGDRQSAFGGIIAVTAPIDDATVERMVAGAQADVVIAPGYEPGAIERLVAKRKNTRLLEAPPPDPDRVHLRPISGGWLVQEPYRFVARRQDWRVVTKRRPTAAEWVDAELAWRIIGWVKSNGVVLVKGGRAVGIGAGQQSRVGAGQIAAQKAGGRAEDGASATDGFYPFPDGVDAAAEARVAVVVQPGGSVNDGETIARADELGVAMVLTGERHFTH